VGLARTTTCPLRRFTGLSRRPPTFVKMDGEKVVDGQKGKPRDRLFVLDQRSSRRTDRHNGHVLRRHPHHIDRRGHQATEITSRDIDRQDFPHYFLKEISEAPLSVERTLLNRWKIDDSTRAEPTIASRRTAFPGWNRGASQRTASGASSSSVRVPPAWRPRPARTSQHPIWPMNHRLQISALKASELSGFQADEGDGPDPHGDTLVVAISQSGTTTDTNRTVDMVRSRGAHTLAIVNRGIRTSPSKWTAWSIPAAAGISKCPWPPPRHFTPRLSPGPCSA
jgi:glucosamine--fructose-6-phosphate aminotransferase (isomerizing)